MTSSSTRLKRPLVVENNGEDDWTLYPTPGFVAKFREAKFTKGASLHDRAKVFINVAHCLELPGPAKDLDENELAKSLSTDENLFDMPLSIGELEVTEDKQGESAFKIDVIVNSTFYNKRVAKSEFFRQITLLLICDAVEKRHGVQLDSAKQVILKNRKFVGEISAQRIRKRPKQDLCEVRASREDESDEPETSAQLSYEELVENVKSQPRNYRVQIVGGMFADIRVRVRDKKGIVTNASRIKLKMNDDRCVVLLDRSSTVADFFLPFRICTQQLYCEFDSGSLIMKCPIDWNQQD